MVQKQNAYFYTTNRPPYENHSSSDCVSDGNTTSCTYPYTFIYGTMRTKGKLLNDREQDLVGLISGTTMDVSFSFSGNFIFSKK